jgi:hypothetical protein
MNANKKMPQWVLRAFFTKNCTKMLASYDITNYLLSFLGQLQLIGQRRINAFIEKQQRLFGLLPIAIPKM